MSDAHYVIEISAPGSDAQSHTVSDERFVIGRRSGDLVIEDSGASGRHAELHFTGETLTVSDLESTNGIVWQESIVREAFQIGVGETFQIGRTKFTISAIKSPSHAPEASHLEEAERDEDGEESTAFISPADLGMEDLDPEPAAPRPEPKLEPLPEKEPPRTESAPAPELGTASEHRAPQATDDDDEAEEATAWMSAVEEDEAEAQEAPEERYTPLPSSPEDWADEPQSLEELPAAPEEAPRDALVNIAERRPNFQGQGAEIFKLFFLQALLVCVSFGLYTPWFLCKFIRYLASRTVFGPTQQGWLYVRFHGEGGQLFAKFFLGYILCALTMGIYAPWFICDLARWFLERSDAVAEDGSTYQVTFSMQGGELLLALLLNYVLTLLSLGVYGAWAYCKVRGQILEHVHIYENGEHVGTMRFVAQGGSLLILGLVQYLLCVVSLGIYVPWAFVKLTQFVNQHTRVRYRERWFRGDFTGSGGAYLALNIVGLLLTQLTLGIYYAWYYAKKRSFETNHEVWYELS